MKHQYIRWYSFAEFLLVGICCILINLFPKLGWWPVIVAALPLILRILWKELPYQKTPFDILLLIFIVSASVGVWVAYDQEQALQKFYLIIGAVLLFLTLANQPAENLWQLILILGLWGALINFIFVMILDWSGFTADLSTLDQMGVWLSTIRPNSKVISGLDLQLIHPNIIGGINAVLMPLCTAAVIHNWRRNKKKFATFIFGCSLIIIGLGLFISSSRGAWASAIVGMGAFGILNKSFIRRILTQKYFLVILPLLIILFGVFAPAILAENFSESNNPISEITSFTSRITIARDTLFLITDFPFTGGGLSSFSGLYSEYMLVIPYFMFSYSHNLYLDLALEQGIPGFLIWTCIIFFSAIILNNAIKTRTRKQSKRFLSTAVYASLIVLLTHGIADDPIYSNLWGLSFFFLLPGFSVAVSDKKQLFENDKESFRVNAVLLSIFLGVITMFYKPISSQWYANIGAINMAKTGLADWPPGEWNERSSFFVYKKVERIFVKSLSFQEQNLTSNYRLGLVWMERQHFQQAIPYLETALLTSPKHRGVQKNLGYCYTWLGEFPKAELILKQIHEAQTEMEVYTWWWQTRGRHDLANNASEMAIRLSD